MSNEIILTIENEIATLTVNRPQARNALNWAAQEQFAAAVTAVGQQTAVRLLIITGQGEQGFVAGGDIKELVQHVQPADGARLHGIMSDALQQLSQLPMPVMAAINGDAFGGGCEILAACDLRIAKSSARFCLAQVKNGLTTGWGGAARLVSLVGPGRAMELLLTGRLFTAVEAQQMGLVHRVVATDVAWETAVAEWANELLALPRSALAALKQLVWASTWQTPAQVATLEQALFVQQWVHADHIEAMAAFLQKRPPMFNQGEPVAGK